jgi:hypothetical protein
MYLSAGKGLAEGHRAESFRHGSLLLDIGDGADALVDLGLVQLILGNLGQIPTIAVIPHAVGSSSERLDLALDEGPDELNARKLFLRSGSKLLDFFHQWLRDLHLLIRKFMFPRHPGPKDDGGLKLLKPKVFATGELVLGVEPFRPPAGIVFGRLEVEVGDVWTHLAAEATSLELQRAPDDENSAPKRPVGFDP